jgi:uncharacterized protein (DUF2141 family)
MEPRRLADTPCSLLRGAALLLSAGAILTTAHAARSQQAGVLKIRFSGLEQTGGALLFSVADSREVFESEDRTQLVAEVPVAGAEGIAVFEKLAPGEYAVKVFHDANGNRKLDIGLMGPKEKYGFSNDVMGFMGPPDFDDAKFLFDGSDMTVDIKAR